MSMSDEPQLHYVSHEDFVSDVRAVAQKVAKDVWQPDYVIGIGRGGLVPAVYISHQLDLPMLSVDHSSKVPGFADELLGKVAEKSRDGTKLLVIDDINDSGGTIEYIRRLLAAVGCDAGNLRFAVLISNSRSKVSVDYWSRTIDRNGDKRWFVFPWEAMGRNDTIVEEARSVPARLA
jgi:uncharacterized protein